MRGASIAVIHCGLIENERTPKKEKKITVGVSLSPASPPCQATANVFCLSPRCPGSLIQWFPRPGGSERSSGLISIGSPVKSGLTSQISPNIHLKLAWLILGRKCHNILSPPC